MITSWGLGALVNLDHPGRFVHWHFIDLSLSNVIVMALMVVTFVVALVAPFPGRRERKGDQ